jgi:hypothetical protein
MRIENEMRVTSPMSWQVRDVRTVSPPIKNSSIHVCSRNRQYGFLPGEGVLAGTLCQVVVEELSDIGADFMLTSFRFQNIILPFKLTYYIQKRPGQDTRNIVMLAIDLSL